MRVGLASVRRRAAARTALPVTVLVRLVDGLEVALVAAKWRRFFGGAVPVALKESVPVVPITVVSVTLL